MSSTEGLFLIAHKVRGEAALDVAELMHTDRGDWWIIPTSGHRAYPFLFWKLGDIIQVMLGEPPADLPDHDPLPAAAKRLDSQSQAPETPSAEDL